MNILLVAINAKYIHSSDDIYQEIDTFVPKDDNAKVNIIHLKNYLFPSLISHH